ncbi:MAG: hypothetical protein IOB84_12540 [Brevundimonas sp.]|nr:hypothetical protein [Brevundimonas sp.]
MTTEFVKTEKRRPIRKPDTLLAKRPLNENDKGAPQARVIFDAIAAAGAEGIIQEALITLLGDGRLKTRQTPDRIFVWYIDELITNGLVEVIYAERAAPAANDGEGGEKPKRTRKPKAVAETEAPAEEKAAA